jgi:predicted MFS family arabinose efflux permease
MAFSTISPGLFPYRDCEGSLLTETLFDDARAKRNAIVLAIAQALYASGTVALVATAGLVGAQLAPSRGWATLPVSTFVLGTMVATIPAALLMRRVGRKPGFILGAIIGAFAGLLSVYAIYEKDFALFSVSTALHGVYQASSGYFRFAAADTASPGFRPKAISWVLTGGVAAALLGTFIVIQTTDLLAPVIFGGCYLATAILAILAIIVLAFLDLPSTTHEESGPARPLLEILRQPRLAVAIACGTMSFSIMNLVMTATPIAMVDCGFGVSESSWVIQWHVLAMFVPSFFTGSLVARFGVERITLFGLVMLMGAAVAALLGIHFLNFALGLVLLGLGWNFAFIGATIMVTDCYRTSERNKVQAVNDFAIFFTVALASLASGRLLDQLGWNAVNLAVFPMAALALLLLLWQAAPLRAKRSVVQ